MARDAGSLAFSTSATSGAIDGGSPTYSTNSAIGVSEPDTEYTTRAPSKDFEVPTADETPSLLSGDYYVYGQMKRPRSSCTPSSPDYLPDLVLAKVESTDFDLLHHPTQSGWWFRYAQGAPECAGHAYHCWSQEAPTTAAKRARLHVVANDVAPEVSVHHKSYNGASAYILVHGGLSNLLKENGSDYTPGQGGDPPLRTWMTSRASFNFRQVVLRTSIAPLLFPDETAGSTVCGAGNTAGSTVRADVIAKSLPYPDGSGSSVPIDLAIVSDYNAYRNIHSVRGHSEVSTDSALLISYYAWHHVRCEPAIHGNETCPIPDLAGEPDLYYSRQDAFAATNADVPGWGAPTNSVSSFRTMSFPLEYLFPWCEQTGACPEMNVCPNCLPNAGSTGQGVCCSPNCVDASGDVRCGGTGCSQLPGGASQCCTGTISTNGILCNATLSNAACNLNCTPDVCCATTCVTSTGQRQCGGDGCSDLPGGTSNCCVGAIMNSGVYCTDDPSNAPCILP